jgi:hypothetical protein
MTFFAKDTFAVLQHLGAKTDRWKRSQWPLTTQPEPASKVS